MCSWAAAAEQIKIQMHSNASFSLNARLLADTSSVKGKRLMVVYHSFLCRLNATIQHLIHRKTPCSLAFFFLCVGFRYNGDVMQSIASVD